MTYCSKKCLLEVETVRYQCHTSGKLTGHFGTSLTPINKHSMSAFVNSLGVLPGPD